MISRLFDSGTSNGQSPVNYLLGDKDHTGKIRSVKPIVISGDPELTVDLINMVDRKYKYTSGVLSFRDNEMPSKEQQKEIIAAFRKTFMPGLDTDNFNDLWVAHMDKGNFEMHFVVVADELKSGKRLNISPPGKKNQDYWNTFTAVVNQRYGWNQVVADPLKIALSSFDLKVHNTEAKSSKVIKNDLSNKLHQNIVDGKIEDRRQLIGFLKKQNVEITRVGKDYISIKMPGDLKARRLKGPMFELGANYSDLVKEHHASKIPKQLSNVEFKEVKNQLLNFINERKEFNTKAYLTHKTSFRRTRKAKNTADIAKSFNESIKNIDTKLSESKFDITKFGAGIEQHQFKDNLKQIRNKADRKQSESSVGITTNTAAGSITSQIGYLEFDLQQVNLQLGSEKDPRKIAELKAKSYRLQMQIRIKYQELQLANEKFSEQMKKAYKFKK